MDLLKELFGNGGEELHVSSSSSSSSCYGGVLPLMTRIQERRGYSDGKDQARLQEIQAHPLPLLPADNRPVQSSSAPISKHTKCLPSATPAESLSPGHTNRDHVDIREVPSEMPMYLLAEDEGNEEEILRLLESDSPGGSPDDAFNSASLISRDTASSEPSTSFANDKGSTNCETSSSLTSTSSRDGNSVESKEKRHSGGWPKGRSRRPPTETVPPKLPANGYTFFALENRRKAEKECGTKSMSVLSRRLGKMWSNLATEQKKVYLNHAQADRARYLEDLKEYVAINYKGMNVERAHKYVIQCFSGESDDNILTCSLCQLQFTSLYNKQSHFSGKLHLQTLLENLNTVQDSQDSQHHITISNSSSGFGVVSSLEEMAKGCHRCLQETSAIQMKISVDLEYHAQLQEQYGDAENNRWKHANYLTSLKTKEMLLRKSIGNILQIVHNFQARIS